MSLHTYFKQSSMLVLTGKPQSGNTRAIANAVLSMDEMLSVHSVLLDTDTKYSVVIQIANSNWAINIRNTASPTNDSNSNWIYVGKGVIKDGSYVEQSYSDIEIGVTAVLNVYIFTWGIGNCIRNICINHSNKYQSGIIYGFFSHALSDDVMCCVTSFKYSNTSFPGVPNTANLYTSSYIYNDTVGHFEQLTFINMDYSRSSIKTTGFKYYMSPFNFEAYTATLGFVNIKWGGAHRLYVLVSNDNRNVEYVPPGTNVSLNGTSVQSIGCILLGT
nr:MAG TPA: hypothetical protein [Caudoviricetes sp.]